MLFAVPLLPHLGRAAPFHHQVNFLVHVLLRFQRTLAWHLHHKATPLGLRAQQLNEVAAPAGALPRHQWQVMHAADADITEHRQPLALHKRVIRRGLLFKLAEASFFMTRRFVPVGQVFVVRHGVVSLRSVENQRVKSESNRRSYIWNDVPIMVNAGAKFSQSAPLQNAPTLQATSAIWMLLLREFLML